MRIRGGVFAIIVIVFLFNWLVVCTLFGLYLNSISAAALWSLLFMSILVVLAISPLSDPVLRLMVNARPAAKREKNILIPLLEDVCETAGVKVPDIFISDSNIPNAFATGNKTVVVTRGLLSVAEKEMLKGVLAHEIGHLINGDTRRLAIALVLNAVGNASSWIILMLSYIIVALGRPFDRTGFISIFFAISIALMRIIITVIQKFLDLGLLAVGRQEEFKADNFAATKAQAGIGLLQFLEYMVNHDIRENGLWARLAATHPPVMLRIDRLEQILTQQEVAASIDIEK